ncbi:hypothetical protein DRN76_00955, partial [Methanosarcinales archaeon]
IEYVSRGRLIAVLGWIQSSVFWDLRDNRVAAAVFWVSKVEMQNKTLPFQPAFYLMISYQRSFHLLL